MLPREERDAFLREACSGDESLEREARSLLTLEHEAEDFLEKPAMEIAAKQVVLEQTHLLQLSQLTVNTISLVTVFPDQDKVKIMLWVTS